MKTNVYLAVLMLGVFNASIAVANLAQNPGFETGAVGPGVATAWIAYTASGYPTSEYYVRGETWARHSGAKSQSWYASMPTRGGISQIIPGVSVGGNVQASVYFADPDPLGPYGPTQFRIGVEPSGGLPTSTGVIWGPWMPVIPVWQQASIQATAVASQVRLVMESTNTMAGGPPAYQHAYPFLRVIVDDANVVVVQPCTQIANVPDANQPPNNPLGIPFVTNYCGPMAAVNITQYWDVVMGNASAAGVNAGLGTQNGAPYIGWWMDTNNHGCPFRANGTMFAVGNGTYIADLAPGVAQFARWDAANSFGCTPPPNLPANKNGYSWTVSTFHNQMQNQGAAWNQMVVEINAGRPLIVSWSYWNPQNPVVAGGVTYYTWGGVVNGSNAPNPDEQWNSPENPEQNAQGPQTIGHDTTAVGYCVNYDPDGAGAMPKTNWVIVHDNWATTAVDVAVPWVHQGQGWSPWVANTLISLNAPQVGSLTFAAGPKNPGNHWGSPAGGPNAMAQIRLTAGAAEGVALNAVTLTASGTGNDKVDVAGVDLVDDANSNGKADAGEAVMASGAYGADNGTLSLVIPGPLTFIVPAGGSRDMVVVYRMTGTGAFQNTYAFQIKAGDAYAAGCTTFLPATIFGLPFNSSTKQIGLQMVPNPNPRVGWLRGLEDGSWVTYPAPLPVVTTATNVFQTRIYIEEPDRSSGIQMYFGDEDMPTLTEGTAISFEAVVDTIGGERVLVQPRIISSLPSAVIAPLLVANKSIGGEATIYCPGVLGGIGLSNEGILVKTWGRVKSIGSDYFTMDDGSADITGGGGGGRPELKVSLAGLAIGNAIALPPEGIYVTVIGISSKEPGGMGYRAVLRPRTQADVAGVPSPYSQIHITEIVRDQRIHHSNQAATFTVRFSKEAEPSFTGTVMVAVRDNSTGTVAMSQTRTLTMAAGETTRDEGFTAMMPYDAVWDIVAGVFDAAGYLEDSANSEYGVRPTVPDVPDGILTYQQMSLYPSLLLAQIQAQDVVELTLGSRTFQLLLSPNDTMLSDEVRAAYPDLKLFKGRVVGNEESEVRLTFNTNRVSGYVMSAPDDMQVIDPLVDYFVGAGSTDYITYNSSAERFPGFCCDMEEGGGLPAPMSAGNKVLASSGQAILADATPPTVRSLLRLNVYADNGVWPVDHLNDAEGTLSHEANVRIYVNSTNWNLNTNAYNKPSNCGTANPSAIGSFSSDANVNLTGVEKAILFTNNGNLSYGNVVGCGYMPGNYCWIKHTGSAWTMRLTVAHELGHNFSLVHDNSKTKTEMRWWGPIPYWVDHYGIMNSNQQSDSVWDDTYNTTGSSQRATAWNTAGTACARRSAIWTGNDLGTNNIRLISWETQFSNNPARGDSMRFAWSYRNSTNNAIVLSKVFIGCRNPNDLTKDFGHIGPITVPSNSTAAWGTGAWTGTAGGVAGNWHFWPAYSYFSGGITYYGPYKWHEAVINFQ